MRPHTDQPGQQILVLGQLHLEASLPGLSPLGENIQNESTSVDDLHTQKLRKHTDLRRRQVIVKDDQSGTLQSHHGLDLLYLALADEAVGVGLIPALEDAAHHLAPGCLHQRGQLLQALLVCAVLPEHRGAQAHQHRQIPFILLQLCAFHSVTSFEEMS